MALILGQLDHKVLVLTTPNFQPDFPRTLLHGVRMLDHKELIAGVRHLQVYEVDLAMDQGMLFPETQAFLAQAYLRLLQWELKDLGEFRIIQLQVHQVHYPNPALHQDRRLGSVPSNWVAPDPPG